MALIELSAIFGQAVLPIMIAVAGLSLIWITFSTFWRWLGRAIRHGRDHATEQLDREISL